MTKRKRSQNDSENECERIIGLKNWELNNEIEDLAFKNTFSEDELSTYLDLHIRFLNAKLAEYNNFDRKISKKKNPEKQQWREDILNKMRKYTRGAIFKTQTMIDEILEKEYENDEEVIAEYKSE